MKKLRTEWTPEEFNSYLEQEYGLSLLPFSYLLLRVVEVSFYPLDENKIEVLVYLKHSTDTFDRDLLSEGSSTSFLGGGSVAFKDEELIYLGINDEIKARIDVSKMIPGKGYSLTVNGKDRIKYFDRECDVMVRKECLGVKVLSDFSKDLSGYDSKKLKNFQQRLKNLKKRIIETMIEEDCFIHGETQNKIRYKEWPYEEFEQQFAKEYGLESFFDIIFQEICWIDDELDTRRPGSPINKRNLLASVWALYFDSLKHNIDWDLITDLLDWFWTRFSNYEIYHCLAPQDGFIDPEYLRNQFYKHPERWKLYYKYYMDRSWFTDKMIIVFGTNISETEMLWPLVIERHKHGDTVLPNKTYFPFAEGLFDTNPEYNFLIIFPDYSYFIT